MSGFFSKLRLATLGAANDAVNHVIDMNSPSALRQGCRDIEDGLARLQNEAAAQAGAVRTLARQKGDLDIQIATALATAKKLNENPANAELVKAKAGQIVQLQGELKNTTAQYIEQQAASVQLDAASTQLKNKLDTYTQRVHELERLDAQTKAKDHATQAISNASHVLSTSIDGTGVDDLEAKIRAKKDVQDVKFERAMGNLTSATTVEVDQSGLDDVLAQINAK